MCIGNIPAWWKNPYSMPGAAFVAWMIAFFFCSMFAMFWEFIGYDNDMTILFGATGSFFLLLCIIHLVRLFIYRNTFLQHELCNQIEQGGNNNSGDVYPGNNNDNYKPPHINTIPVIYVGKNTKDVYMI